MIEIRTLDDLATLSETVDLECKLAAGKDGKGQLPADFWPTYSAFANTHGGVILLGVKEKQGRFFLQGVLEPQRIVIDLFNVAKNTNKVNVNLLTDQNVRIVTIEGRDLIQVHVPAAQRKQKPVFLNGNPFKKNTYRRLHDGDRHCDDATVKRMLAEQVEDSRDTRILAGFSLKDLDAESLRAYHNMFAAHRPDHPWISLDDQEFLQILGGFRQDRQTGEKGLTLAGLLMFGQWPALQEGVPNYFVDYQEQPEDKTSQTRWLDRVVPDGAWSGNLFDFFRKISRKLVADVKVPFVLKGNFRQDDTPMHRALREALVNTLVHADYSDRASILVVKDPAGFLFRNPGLMRVPAKRALQGGESDCRNRTLH
jgi:predicted HTH transcriptional regulator